MTDQLKQQNSQEPVLHKDFRRDVDIEKYMDEGGILAKFYLMMQSNPSVIEGAFNSSISPIDNEKGIILFNAKLHEVKTDVNFLGVAELKLLAKDFRSFINLAMKYGPVRVDLMEPDKISISIDHAQNILADVSEMHKILMAHVASALKEGERVVSPWDVFDMSDDINIECKKDSNKISASILIELQHNDAEILEKLVEAKKEQLKGDENINLIDISDIGIKKNSEIVAYVDDDYDEEENKERDKKIDEEEDFYSDVLEVKIDCENFRELLIAVMKYLAAGVEIFEIKNSKKIVFSREEANRILSDVIKTGHALSEELQSLIRDPERKALYDAAIAESNSGCGCGTCRM